VLVISAPLNLLWLWGRRVSAGQIAAPHQPAQTPVAALEQLPLRLGQRLICLQMEDHYVRVHTDTGSELVLSPLKDAIDALSGVEGLQVHRSWWVAREAVVRPLRRGRQVELELANGLLAPVSRASIARLKAAGWLTADDA
jgi:DNA-binding LytR/AlgR family response regulator